MSHRLGAKARLLLMGQFRLLASDGTDISPRSSKARALLGYVALAPGASADRGRLAGLLWSEGGDAKASLRQCLRELRSNVAAMHDELVGADTQKVWINLARLSVDAHDLRDIRSASDEAIAALARLWEGDLLADVVVGESEYEQWVVTERAALRDRAIRRLEQAMDAALAADDADRTSRAADIILRIDPAHEPAHRSLIRRHGQRGDLAAAVHQYEICKGALRRQLDATPSAETETLLREVKQGRLRLAPAPRRIMPQVAAARPTVPSIEIEEQSPASGNELDRTVTAAVGAALRQALARKRWLTVVEPRLLQPTRWRVQPSPKEDDPKYTLRFQLVRAQRGVRLCAELYRRGTGELLWAHHYDRKLGTDVFGLVDELASAVARWLDREIEVAEITRVARHVTEPQDAYDCVLRAIPLIFKLTPDSFADARRLLVTASKAAPNDALVYAWWAFWAFLNIGQGWAEDPVVARQELDFVVRRALELDPGHPIALAVAAHIASFVEHDYEKSFGLFERSLQLDPTSAYALDLSALALCYSGRPVEGLERLHSTRDIWERHPNAAFFRTTACIGLFLAGRYEQAVELCRRTIRESPSFHAPYRPLIASLGQLGKIDEARDCVAALRRFEPGFSIDWFRANYPPLQQDDSRRYVDGLRKAGVPED